MFKSWCSKNNLKNAKATSHVLMDGGVLSIPFDKLDEFCERYIEAVKNKEEFTSSSKRVRPITFSLTSTIKMKRLSISSVSRRCAESYVIR